MSITPTPEPDPRPLEPAGEVPPADDPSPEWDEVLFRRTNALLTQPESETAGGTGRAWVWLVVTAALFAISSFTAFDSMRTVGFLLAVLFVHEAGHFLGMRLFGYKDVRMFFVPFFGAAVTGRKHAAPAWQHAIVLLLGPLPGIVAALGLTLWLRPTFDEWLGDLLLLSAIVNGANLLPLVPLDGGRLLDLLLFARRPALAAAFRCLAAVGLGVVACFSGWGAACVGVLAVGTLLSAPFAYRKARVQRAFRDNPLALPTRMEDLDESQRRELFGWAVLLHQVDRSPPSLAAEVRQLHERMVSGGPSRLAAAGFLLVYAATAAAAVWAALLIGENTTRDRKARAEEKADIESAELADAFRKRADLRADLRKRSAAAAARDPEEAGRLIAEADRAWEELVQLWKQADTRTRSRATVRLFTDAQLGGKDYKEDLSRLLLELQPPRVPDGGGELPPDHPPIRSPASRPATRPRP